MAIDALDDIVRVMTLRTRFTSGSGSGPIPPEKPEDDVIIKAIANMTLNVGDWACVAPDGRVTLATSAALALAGANLGVVTVGGDVDQEVKIQVDGLLTPVISGVTAYGPVDVDPTTGHSRLAPGGQFAQNSFPIGFSNAAGYLTMVRGVAVNVGAPVTTYTSIGGLVARYTANALAGANGSSVAAWNDSTPSANHLLQATGGAQPTIVTGAVNGKKAVSFNGTSQFMRCANLVINSREMSIYMVMALRTVGSGGFVFEYNVSSTGMNHAGATGFPQIVRAAGSAGYLTNIAGAGHAIRSAQFRDDGTNELFYQGVSRNTFTDATLIPPNAPFDLGAHSNGSSLFAPIDVAEILIYNGKHSTATAKVVYNLLALDYGFSVLP